MTSDRVRVLLTVPHLCRSASPYREMIAIASHCSRAGFCLTVCGLRDAGWEETKPLLDRLSVGCFVAPFRPRGHSFFDFVESVAGQRIIASHGPFEIQHSLDFTSSPFEALMARAAGRCFVFSQRNLNDQGHTASLRLKIRLSHRVVAIAAHMAGFLRDLGTPPAKIVEIFNGIDLDDVAGELRSTPLNPTERILMVGQVVRLKRYEDALRAFHLIAARFPKLHLEIVGHLYDPAYRQELDALAASLGVADRVHFVGARADVLGLMRDSRIFLLCSRSEGLPWAPLEAMAAGVPVVASDIPANREIVDHGHTGFLVPVGDCGVYADAITRILSLPEARPRMLREARLRVERFYSARTMVAGLECLYRQLRGRQPDSSSLDERISHVG